MDSKERGNRDTRGTCAPVCGYRSGDALGLAAMTQEAAPLSQVSCRSLRNLWNVECSESLSGQARGKAMAALFAGRQHAHISVTLSLYKLPWRLA